MAGEASLPELEDFNYTSNQPTERDLRQLNRLFIKFSKKFSEGKLEFDIDTANKVFW